MNKNPICPRCHAEHVVKAGRVLQKQRYRCKNCGLQFTRLTPRGKSPDTKAKAVELYAKGLSMRSIARMLDVSATSVLRWIRVFAEKTYKKPEPDSVDVVELDEMWHYVNSKKTNFGYGKHIVGIQAN